MKRHTIQQAKENHVSRAAPGRVISPFRFRRYLLSQTGDMDEA